MKPENNVSSRLKEALGLTGLTQKELAEKLEVSSAAVSQWLTGKKEPSREMLNQAAKILTVDAAWLAFGTGEGPQRDLAAERSEYESQTSWIFRPTPDDGGRDYGNANLWALPWDIDTLVKEAGQNVIDAAVDVAVGCELCINIIKLSGTELKQFLETLKWESTADVIGLREHISKSAENKQKLGKILRDGMESLKKDKELILVRFDDFQTKGLVGPENGAGNFTALCRNNLDSQKGSDNAGGAYGLGKAVFWRASKFSTVLFCSNLSEPYITDDGTILKDLRIIGKADLAWHQIKADGFAGPGWFGSTVYDDNHMPIRTESIWNNPALANDLYLNRNDHREGTSILIVGFQDPSADTARSLEDTAIEFEKAISKNFWPALLSGKLTAQVKVWEGRTQKSTTSVDPQQHHPYFTDAVSKYKNNDFVEKLRREGDITVSQIPLRIPRRNTEPKHEQLTDEAVLIVRRAPDDYKGDDLNQVAFFRGQEMVIMYQNLRTSFSGGIPFHAVVLCGLASGSSDTDKAADQFLRNAEPPAHDRWTTTPELRVDYGWGFRTSLDSFFRSVKDKIRELIKPSYDNLDDGPRDLKELLKVYTKDPIETPTGPRITHTEPKILSNGSWQISVRVRLPDDQTWRAAPILVFAAESGAGKRTPWTIKPTSGCTLDGDFIISKAGAREMRFVGTSDPASHPIAAEDSAVSIVLNHAQPQGN